MLDVTFSNVRSFPLKLHRSFSNSNVLFDPGDIYKRMWWSATQDARLSRRKKLIKLDITDRSLFGFNKTKVKLYGFNRLPQPEKCEKRIKSLKIRDLMNPENKPIRDLVNLSRANSSSFISPWFFRKEVSDLFQEDNPKERLLKKNLIRHNIRGWTGRYYRGKSANCPRYNDKVLTEFDSVVIDIKKSNVKVGESYSLLQRALVVIGNGDGVIGYGIGYSREPSEAVTNARENATKNIYRIPIADDYSIIHRVRSQMNNLKISYDARPDGYGLRCHRIIKSICKLGGIRNLHARLLGNSNNPVSIVQATFQALATQETHDELAQRTGCYVIKMNPENFNIPEVVAIPTSDNISRANIRRHQTFDYEFANQLDPYQGLHRPRRITLFDRTTIKPKKGKRRLKYIVKEIFHGRRY